MESTIAIVGPGDRQLEQQLRARGLSVVNWTERDLVARRSSPAPDFLMLDVRGQSQLPAPLEVFRHQYPSVSVLLLLSALEPSMILAAMRAGVKECLQHPVTDQELDAAFSRMTSSRDTGAAGEVFAFLGAKGGVGTTTAAVNVATELARLHRGSVLLIDLHLAYGDAAVYLGAEPKFSVADALENIRRLDTAYLRGLCVKTKAGLDLLASPDRGIAVVVDTSRLRTLIDSAAHSYRYVVLDVCRTDPAVLDSLDPAAKILVIANQELATVRGASRIATTLNQRYGRDRVLVAVSRYDPNAGIGQSDIERVVGSKIRHLLPSDYRVAVEALNTGRPLAISNETRLAGAFKVLARELAGLGPETSTTTGGRSIFGRITGR